MTLSIDQQGVPMTTKDTGQHIPSSGHPRPAGKVDFTFMYAAHDAFTRDLRRLAAAVEAGRTADPAVRTGWATLKNQLHVHHTAEDVWLWPPLRDKGARPLPLPGGGACRLRPHSAVGFRDNLIRVPGTSCRFRRRPGLVASWPWQVASPGSRFTTIRCSPWRWIIATRSARPCSVSRTTIPMMPDLPR